MRAINVIVGDKIERNGERKLKIAFTIGDPNAPLDGKLMARGCIRYLRGVTVSEAELVSQITAMLDRAGDEITDQNYNFNFVNGYRYGESKSEFIETTHKEHNVGIVNGKTLQKIKRTMRSAYRRYAKKRLQS